MLPKGSERAPDAVNVRGHGNRCACGGLGVKALRLVRLRQEISRAGLPGSCTYRKSTYKIPYNPAEHTHFVN